LRVYAAWTNGLTPERQLAKKAKGRRVPIGTQRAWLTEETYERARIELAELLTRRAAGSFVEHGDEEQCARRICRLQELLGDAVVGYEPPDDGVAEPGMVLTVRYEADELSAVPYRPDHRANRDERSFARWRLRSPQRSAEVGDETPEGDR
jgi:hypothetical protein